MARPERFELPTLWFEARCSDPLSYGRVTSDYIAGKVRAVVWLATAHDVESELEVDGFS
jgi:hypothetical protein